METGTPSTALKDKNYYHKMALGYCFGSKETQILEKKADDLAQTFKIFGKCVTNDKFKSKAILRSGLAFLMSLF